MLGVVHFPASNEVVVPSNKKERRSKFTIKLINSIARGVIPLASGIMLGLCLRQG